MKLIQKRITKKIIAVLLCIAILISNISMYIPKEKNTPIEEVAKVENFAVDYNRTEQKNVTSRSGLTTREKEKIEYYTIYEFIINNETFLYFENIENANLQKDYLLKNTDNVNVTINELVKTNKNDLSETTTINNTVENYIARYKKKIICFPTKSHSISSTYGYRKSRGDFHSGIDLQGNYGDNIYAYKSGTIIKTQYSNVSYGNMVLIQHNDGTQSRYAHMSSISVSKGQYVNCGQIIGHVGSTGNSTGNHLHFEIIINGKTVNPYNYIF